MSIGKIYTLPKLPGDFFVEQKVVAKKTYQAP